MAFGRRNQSGLDLGGVGKTRLQVRGGTMNSAKQGLPISNRGGYGNYGRPQKRAPERFRALFIVVGVIVALAIAIGVGIAVYRHTIESAIRPELSEAVLEQELTKTDETIQWALLIKTDATTAEKERGGVQSTALIAIDTENFKASILWIDPEMRMYVAGRGYLSAKEAFQYEQETAVITGLENLAAIKISHYFELNSSGWDKLSELYGLTGKTGSQERMQGLAEKLLGSSNEQLSTGCEDLCQYVASDLDAKGCQEVLSIIQGIDLSTSFNQVAMPTREEKNGTDIRKVADEDQWATVLERIDSGMDPVASKDELFENKNLRSSFRVTVWNGVGVSGVAGDCADFIKSKGWRIKETTNAASFVYEETLIVYRSDDDKAAADLMVADLGQGRAVPSAARYSFKGDLLVVVGKDYKLY